MTEIMEVTTNIAGPGTPLGVSRMYFVRTDLTAPLTTDAENAVSLAAGLWQAVKPYIPNSYTVRTQPTVTVKQSDTAAMVTILVSPGGAIDNDGTDTNDFALGVGASIGWKTSTVRGRRMMRARTFLLPIANDGFTSGGGLTTTLQGIIATAGAHLLSNAVSDALEYISWHRPTAAAPTSGSIGQVTALSVPFIPAFLQRRKNG